MKINIKKILTLSLLFSFTNYNKNILLTNAIILASKNSRNNFNEKKHFNNLPVITAFGIIQSQLHGEHGEVNGVTLNEGSIIHFAPKLLEENSEIKIDIGQSIKASGHGTRNSIGQTFEANEITNQ